MFITGIITDTGSFSYSCNYVATYLIISELFKLGIDGEQIHRLVYDTYSEDRMRLLGYCLSEKLKVFQKYGTAYISLTKEDLKRFNFQVGDTEGVVELCVINRRHIRSRVIYGKGRIHKTFPSFQREYFRGNNCKEILRWRRSS